MYANRLQYVDRVYTAPVRVTLSARYPATMPHSPSPLPSSSTSSPRTTSGACSNHAERSKAAHHTSPPTLRAEGGERERESEWAKNGRSETEVREIRTGDGGGVNGEQKKGEVTNIYIRTTNYIAAIKLDTRISIMSVRIMPRRDRSLGPGKRVSVKMETTAARL